VVNEALAAKIFPNEDPLGKRLRFWNYQGRDLEWEIVGVVGNVRQMEQAISRSVSARRFTLTMD
jgi:hypothetical protein